MICFHQKQNKGPREEVTGGASQVFDLGQVGWGWPAALQDDQFKTACVPSA